MILRKALPKRGGLGDQIGVISRLRAKQRRFELPGIAKARGAAIALDLVFMNGERLDDRKVVGHLASFS